MVLRGASINDKFLLHRKMELNPVKSNKKHVNECFVLTLFVEGGTGSDWYHFQIASSTSALVKSFFDDLLALFKFPGIDGTEYAGYYYYYKKGDGANKTTQKSCN